MNLEIKTDIPFAVPIFSVEFPGISGSLNLERNETTTTKQIRTKRTKTTLGNKTN